MSPQYLIYKVFFFFLIKNMKDHSENEQELLVAFLLWDMLEEQAHS